MVKFSYRPTRYKKIYRTAARKATAKAFNTRVFNARRRRRTKGNAKSRFVLYNSLIQESILTSLRYCQVITLLPVNGSNYHTYALNGCHLPDISVPANIHKPAYWKEWITHYDAYRVLKLKYRIVFTPEYQDTDVSDMKLLHTDAVSGETYPYVLNQPERDNHIVFAEVDTSIVPKMTEPEDRNFLRETGYKMSGVQSKIKRGRKPAVITGTVSVRDILSSKDNYLKTSVTTSNPSDLAYIFIGAMSQNGFDTNGVRAEITLDYFVEFSKEVDPHEDDQTG